MRALLVGLALLVAAPAWAEEPKGFREFTWGTSDDAMRGFLALEGCSWSGSAQVKSKTCPGIRLGDSRFMVTFTFADERFVAYRLWVPQSRYLDLSEIALAKFGPGTKAGRDTRWKWNGAAAELIEWCGRSSDSCLGVWAPAYDKALAEQSVKRGKNAAKDF